MFIVTVAGHSSIQKIKKIKTSIVVFLNGLGSNLVTIKAKKLWQESSFVLVEIL